MTILLTVVIVAIIVLAGYVLSSSKRIGAAEDLANEAHNRIGRLREQVNGRIDAVEAKPSYKGTAKK
jgi:hypothetical protein